ncbi:putative RNA polymerase II subunit B1 CTD phosphatase RPAP2 [Odontomachus brunneus]|uniref:putative RNA polymerase II subunit B1 CTD phosphatase RPAP2 n=1 Tax=Odontomachus brunneus TaxID=486640 RepID=UPI0013F23403|nr:putative RNA polymerase II subunit B1 CTD phosphatase RPAP2 [Odontomachus brunneus]
MSGTKERTKVKKHMKKIDLQLAIIKKKQCDAKALAIVEQLLEPNVNSDWLIQHLKFINKTHMEDVIEERTIVKLCGYVLCSKPLTAIIKQQYCISTRTNKVYDISKRKKFCSSKCYGASNYLLEQMLESPLWLREKEVIPDFKILPINSVPPLPGDEVRINFLQNTDTDNIDQNRELQELYITKQIKNHPSPTVSSTEIENNSHSSNNTSVEEHTVVEEILTNIENLHETSELCTNQQDKLCGLQVHTNNDHIQEENTKSENLETHIAVKFNKIQCIHEHIGIKIENANATIVCSNSDTEILQAPLDEISDNTNNSSKMSHFQLDKVNNSQDNKDNKIVQLQLDRVCNNQNITISTKPSNNAGNKSKKIKNKNVYRQEESDNAEVQANAYHNLIIHIEQSFREWITEDTLCLLLDEGDEKTQLLKNLTQQDRYEQLCKKLNRLQLQDKKEDRANFGKNFLKPSCPLPHLSVLQEEGKKIELKVRAFYQGQMVIVKDNKSKDGNEDKQPILSLTDAHAPNALRRRIFLDKLNKILPDLLCTLTNASTSSVTQRIYDNVYLLIKLLVSTFYLSATNIVFKTAEWTLVGLIIIKMLSLIDMQMQSLLASKQASMYMSMILMTYKLDSNYVNRLVMDVINNKNTCKP